MSLCESVLSDVGARSALPSLVYTIGDTNIDEPYTAGVCELAPRKASIGPAQKYT